MMISRRSLIAGGSWPPVARDPEFTAPRNNELAKRLVTFTATVALAMLTGVTPLRGQVSEPPRPDVQYLPAAAALPFSEAVRVGNTIYLAGTIGTGPDGKLVPGGIQPETRQVLENIRGTLQKFGATMDDLVTCTVFLADIAEWSRMNEVYVTFFPKHFPARSAFAASGLALNARAEIQCMAVIGARGAK